MNIDSVKLACFSPTGTTRAVLQAIGAGGGFSRVELIDITRPEGRTQPLATSDDELLVIGVPVYMGRVPALLADWLETLQAAGTPTVCVVVYGNRAFENALLELKDTVASRGCIPIAGAAFIGEHSFANEETSSMGRPDAEDLEHARRFGEQIREKLLGLSSIGQENGCDMPGEFPYAGRTTLWDVDFIAVSNLCTQCGVCAAVCPVGAVDKEHSADIDVEKCITCCACIKKCPQQARSIKPGLVKDAQHRITTLFAERKEPEVFI